jgi:hypothetical protein
VLEGEFPQDAGECDGMGKGSRFLIALPFVWDFDSWLVEGQEVLELLLMLCAPSLDFSKVGDNGEESKKNEGGNGVKRMGYAWAGARIGDLVEVFDKDGKGNGVGLQDCQEE